jgi:hypothetical protein
MSLLLAILYCFTHLAGFIGPGPDRIVAVTPRSACVASQGNVQGYWRGTTVKVIFDGCSASWCTALCATTPLLSS